MAIYVQTHIPDNNRNPLLVNHERPTEIVRQGFQYSSPYSSLKIASLYLQQLNKEED
jgi:hypothetical protein